METNPYPFLFLYMSISENLKKVVDIFNDHFGEDKVDLQEDFILVHFPEVTVTNEYDKSVDITHLYVKVPVDSTGRMSGIFRMNRSEYTEVQYNSDYMHSHISGIPKYDLSKFLEPCLGRGPIRDTISSLCVSCNFDLWQLFVVELDRYVHTESVKGVPYRRLENIGVRSNSYKIFYHVRSTSIYNSISYDYDRDSIMTIIKEFLRHYLNKVHTFTFNSHSFMFGYSDEELHLDMSNAFIEWFNSKPTEFRKDNISNLSGILESYLHKDGNFYSCIGNNRLNLPTDEIELFNFKGKPVYFKMIKNETVSEDNIVTLINLSIYIAIKTQILTFLNLIYGESIANKEIEYL